MKINNAIVPKAIDVLVEAKIVQPDDLRVEPAYGGYLSSFGAAIIQSGLFPAVIFFEQAQSRAKADRTLVPKAVLLFLQEQHAGSEDQQQATSLSQYLLASTWSESRMVALVQEAIVGLKLALRTFLLESPQVNNHAE